MRRSTLATLLCGVLGAFLAGAPAAAQERPPRPPRDPVPARDTAAVADSTIVAADTVAADSAVVVPLFSEIFAPTPGDVGHTTFSWDSAALLREGAITLADLLERVPGMTGIRAGLYLQPEAVTAFGQTRGRIEVVLDGYVIDPQVSSTLDLAHLELIQLNSVRVERRLDMTRIHLTTAEATRGIPYSRVEAATGEPDGTVFRGLFIAPHVIVGPLALGIDRVDSDGVGNAAPADLLGLWGKWSWLAADSSRGLQLEYRQSRLRREQGVPWVADRDRRDVVFRARQRLARGFAAELFAGHGRLRETRPDTIVEREIEPGVMAADTLEPAIERAHWQVGARGSFRRDVAWLDAELRMRDSWALPNRQVDVSAGLRPLPLLAFAGNLTSAAWRGPASALSWDVRAELRPIPAFGAFAELIGGERGAPLYRDTLGLTSLEMPVLESRVGQRFGANLKALGLDATAAWVRLEDGQVAPFGLPFDTMLAPQAAGQASGFDVFGRLVLWPRLFNLYGAFNSWTEAPGWLYLPTRSWRAGLELHTLPLASDNLEIFARVESQRRGPMLVPDPALPVEGASAAPIELAGQHMLHGYLHIRIIDVRAFIQWSDMMAERRQDLPGRLINGRRIVYGVKWQLFN